MPFDDRKIPAIIICMVAIILLAIAFYYNFIPSEEINIDDSDLKSQILRRDSNILFDNIEIKSYGNKIDSPGTLIVIGQTELDNDLNNDVLIQLINDTIYTVTMPCVERKGLILNFWNNSNFVKNIKTTSSFISNPDLTNPEKGKFITIKQQKVITLQSTGKSWLIINNNDIIENRELILKYIIEQTENLIGLNKLSVDSFLQNMEKKFISQFNDDKNNYNNIIADKFKELQDCVNNKISNIDLTSIEKRLYDGIKCKMSGSIQELNCLKEEIKFLGIGLKKQILESMYTENSEFRSKILLLINNNKSEILQEIKFKIESSMDSQVSSILSKLDSKINSVFDGKIREYILQIKEYFNAAIHSKIEEYISSIVKRIDNTNERINKIKESLESTIENEILLLQEKFQSQITAMKENIMTTIDNKLDNIQKRFNTIKNEINDKIDLFKSTISTDIVSYKQSLKNEISTYISTIRNELTLQISTISEEIKEQIEKQQSYIDSQIQDQKLYVENQLEEIQTKFETQKKFIQGQIQNVKLTIETDKSDIYNNLILLESQISTLSAELTQLQNNIKTGTVNFNDINASEIILASTLNNVLITCEEGTLLYTDTSQNTFLGNDYAMNNSSTYKSNVGIGANTFSYATMNFGCNTFVGCNGFRNSSGDYNTGVGYNNASIFGDYNSVFGYKSGIYLYGNYNLAFGYSSGQYLNGNYNTLLGTNTTAGNSSDNTVQYSYSTALGATAAITQSNQIVIGGSNNGIFPNVYIPGTVSIGVVNPSSNVDFEVQGNSQFNSNISVGGSLYATNGFQIPIFGGYIVSINSSGQYSYIPLVFSTSSIQPLDSYFIINPGYKILLYNSVNFSGDSYTIDNTTGVTSISSSSVSLCGTNNSITSYSLYFNGNIISAL